MPPIPSATTAAASGRAHLPDGARDGLIARYQDKHSPDQISGRLALFRAGQTSHTIFYRTTRPLDLHYPMPVPCRRVLSNARITMKLAAPLRHGHLEG